MEEGRGREGGWEAREGREERGGREGARERARDITPGVRWVEFF